MRLAADVAAALVAAIHVWILVLEMFLWRKPIGLRLFRLTPERAETTAVLAANQGLYNGFLAAGLFWGLALGGAPAALPVRTFFLTCVVVAGVYGALTANRRILFVQALPALLALALARLAA